MVSSPLRILDLIIYMRRQRRTMMPAQYAESHCVLTCRMQRFIHVMSTDIECNFGFLFDVVELIAILKSPYSPTVLRTSSTS